MHLRIMFEVLAYAGLLVLSIPAVLQAGLNEFERDQSVRGVMAMTTALGVSLLFVYYGRKETRKIISSFFTSKI